jgi:hypothetical protein
MSMRRSMMCAAFASVTPGWSTGSMNTNVEVRAKLIPDVVLPTATEITPPVVTVHVAPQGRLLKRRSANPTEFDVRAK